MSLQRSLRNSLPAWLLAGSLAALYLRTLAPGLTWANGGKDGGDLIAAAATGGIPHPTGYPLYLLLAGAFQVLPAGSLAFRTNLLSAIATILAAVLVYGIVKSASRNAGGTAPWLAGLAAGWAFGLAPLIWSQAVITEVYGVQGLLVALLMYLYATDDLPGFLQKHLSLWRGLALGMAMGNQVTTLLLLPAVLVSGSVHMDDATKTKRFRLRDWKLDRGALLRQVVMAGMGLSIYLILPLRALANPPVNWGNAITLERFWWLISGEFYRGYSLSSLADAWGRLPSSAGLWLQQFGLPGAALGLIGLILFWRSSRLYLLTLWTAIVFTVFAVFYGSADSYVYLIPAFLCFAIWVGLGVAGLFEQGVQRSRGWRVVLVLLAIAYLGGRAALHAGQVDASQDDRAESFGREVLSTVPEHAILFAQGDRAIFTLWYFHFALGERPDVTVLAEDLLHFDWYLETVQSTYPSLILPGPFPWTETITEANPSRPVCYVRASDSTSMHCLPPAPAR